MRLLVILIILILPKITKPQSVSTLMGGRSAGLANASANLNDEWSLFNNIAGLAKTKMTTFGFAYALHPGLPGANRMAAGTNIPVPSGVVAMGLFRFGDELYSEQLISTGYANQFGLASLGIKLNYIQYRAEGFGTRSALSINFGGIAEITPIISVGAYITNLNQPKLSADDEERLPAKLVTGIQISPSQELALFAEVEKDIDHQPTVKGAIEYAIYQKIKIRTGFNLGPNSIHGGIGYKTSRLNVDYALHYNPTLKTQFQISTGYKLIHRNKTE